MGMYAPFNGVAPAETNVYPQASVGGLLLRLMIIMEGP